MTREETALEVRELATELRALWLLMPSALPRDSIGLLNDGRGGGGGSGSPSPANTAVIDAAAMIEAGVFDVAAQASRLLRVSSPSTTLGVLGELELWWQRLTQLQQPLARHLVGDLRAWTRAAQGAVGTRARDTVMDELCPDHRDTDPTQLRHLGSVAKIDPTLLEGPPAAWRSLVGPQCTRPAWQSMCPHESCARIREQRHIVGSSTQPAGKRRRRDSPVVWSNWIRTPAGEPRWSPCPRRWPPESQPREGNLAFRWQVARTIRCPHCRQTWTSTEERRLLAKRLAELGDAAPDAAALIT